MVGGTFIVTTNRLFPNSQQILHKYMDMETELIWMSSEEFFFATIIPFNKRFCNCSFTIGSYQITRFYMHNNNCMTEFLQRKSRLFISSHPSTSSSRCRTTVWHHMEACNIFNYGFPRKKQCFHYKFTFP